MPTLNYFLIIHWFTKTNKTGSGLVQVKLLLAIRELLRVLATPLLTQLLVNVWKGRARCWPLPAVQEVHSYSWLQPIPGLTAGPFQKRTSGWKVSLVSQINKPNWFPTLFYVCMYVYTHTRVAYVYLCMYIMSLHTFLLECHITGKKSQISSVSE